MIKGEEGGGALPDELHPQLLARFVKFGGVEQHLFLVELSPGRFEYVLRDYLPAWRAWGATITIPLALAPELAKELRKSRTPPRRRSRR